MDEVTVPMTPGQSEPMDIDNPQEPLTSWKSVHSFYFPCDPTPYFCGNKTITYAILNTVRTWNCVTRREKLRFVPIEKSSRITALAELSSKTLIVGTEKGQIYVEKGSSWIDPPVFNANPNQEESSNEMLAVTKILVIGPAHVIAEFKNGQKSLIHVNKRRHLHLFEKETKVCRFKQNFFASLRNGYPEITNVNNPASPVYKFDDINQKFEEMRAEKEQFLLLKHWDGGMVITIWDVEKEETSKTLLWNEWTDKFKCIVLIDSKTFIVPGLIETNKMHLQKFVYDEEQKKWTVLKQSKPAGNCKVSNMIQVEDCIMYTTCLTSYSFKSGIHVFDKDLCLSFSSEKFTNRGTKNCSELKALNDDCVAVILPYSVYIIKRHKIKRRLFIGEGDFSFTEAFIKKHEGTAKAITATEIKTRSAVDEEERLKFLEDQGVKLQFEVDAQKIHERFASTRFERIHWNCPYGNSYDEMNSRGAFQDVIPNFFASCRKIQGEGDRVYVTLMKNFTRVPIVDGSMWNGYLLVKKRKFGNNRYPGYNHVKTNGTAYTSDDEQKELVFEKISFDEAHVIEKPHKIGSGSNLYFECTTDDDSSDHDEA